MKQDRRNITFFNFSDSNFSHPDLFSKINGEIVNFARLAAISSEDYGSLIPLPSLVINDDHLS